MPDQQLNEDDSGQEEVLLFETSPYENVDAIVQHDGRSVYFYLNGQSGSGQSPFGTRACWVRNLDIGPFVINQDELNRGLPPMLPRTHCRPDASVETPAADNLRIVWFEEGTGAALQEYSNSENPFSTLAVIPPWSGMEGFHGYARDCAEESEVCWPMPDNPALFKRIQRSHQFWSLFAENESHPFPELQSKILHCLNEHMATLGIPFKENYFAIDGGKFPPRGLVHFQAEHKNIWSTVGMSLCPQPMVELYTENPGQWRRIELAFQMDDACDPATANKVSQWMGSLGSFPWRNFTWLGHGHTCQMKDVMEGFDAALLFNDSALHPDGIVMPEFRDDPIQLLWLKPLTDAQKDQLISKKITVGDLLTQS